MAYLPEQIEICNPCRSIALKRGFSRSINNVHFYEPVSELVSSDDDFETFPAWRIGGSTSGKDTRLPTNNCLTCRSYGGGPRLGSMYMLRVYYLLDHCAVGPELGRTLVLQKALFSTILTAWMCISRYVPGGTPSQPSGHT